MNTVRKPLFQDGTTMETLATLFSKSTNVTKHDTRSEKEAWTLAHDFSDLELSFCRLLDDVFPKMLNTDLTAEDVECLLFDAGEELRHILYHIENNNYFRYLRDILNASE